MTEKNKKIHTNLTNLMSQIDILIPVFLKYIMQQLNNYVKYD